MPLYRWARGYEWTVIFLSVDGGDNAVVRALSSPKHSLNPPTASVAIRPADCLGCFYIDSLIAGNQYVIDIGAINSDGQGTSASITATPSEIPGPPSSVLAVILSGIQVEVFFSPPSGNALGITAYTVSWDTVPDFTHSISSTASCSSDGYGTCTVSGVALSGIPPYAYVISSFQLKLRTTLEWLLGTAFPRRSWIRQGKFLILLDGVL